MPKTECIWNRDLEGFSNCCIWAYIECNPEGCVERSDTPVVPTIPKVKCIECIEKDILDMSNKSGLRVRHEIISKPSTKEYEETYDRIFGTRKLAYEAKVEEKEATPSSSPSK